MIYFEYLETPILKKMAEDSFYYNQFIEERKCNLEIRESDKLYQELKKKFEQYIFRKGKVIGILKGRIVDLERLMRKTRTQLFGLKNKCGQK